MMGVVRVAANLKMILIPVFLVLVFQTAVMAQQVTFSDVTDAMQAWGWRVDVNGVRISAYNHGVSWGDVNNDSIPDLYISSAVRRANGRIPETLYIGQPKGGAFSEEDGKRGVSDSHGMTGTHGISLFDYDNDGDLDIYNATTDDRNRLYRNDGNGFFKDVSDSANLKAIKVFVDTYGEIGYGTRGVVAFDADNDGYMDLLGVNWGPVENKKEVPWITPPQPNEFYRNNGDGTFTKEDHRGLTHPPNPSNIGTQGVTAADINNDGWMDVFISHRNYAYLGKDAFGNDLFGPGPVPAPNQLLINDGTGHFRDETLERGLFDATNDCNGTTFADYDNDGDLDAFVVPKEITTRYLSVYENDGNGYFTNVSSRVRIDLYGFSCVMGDLNNDGFVDIFAPRSYGDSRIYLNDGNGNFVLQSNTGVEILAFDPRGAGLADYDLDGDLDIYYAEANKDIKPRYSNRLFRNNLSKTNRWLKVTGRGPKGDGGAFGTKIWLFEPGHMDDLNYLVGYRQVMNTYGYLCQDDPVQHFGLGVREIIDVKVRFLDGTELKMAGVGANRKVIFTRPQRMDKVSGDDQQGTTGAVLPLPLRVRVSDADGRPVRGARVRFANQSGLGHFLPTDSVFTGSDGIAAVQYAVAPALQIQEIIATSPDFPGAVPFTVRNLNAATAALERLSPPFLSGPAAEVLQTQLTVRVSDGAGVPLALIPVVFKVTLGGGSVAEADSVIVASDAQGLAHTTWRLGPQSGASQQVKASLRHTPGIAVYFDGMTHGLASEMQWPGPTHYNGTAGHALSDSLAVQINDAFGQPVNGYPVAFAVLEGNGQVNGANQVQVLSNAEGLARCQWRLGTVAGIPNRIRATAGALSGSPVEATATAAAGAAHRLLKVSGDGQSAVTQAAFRDLFIASVTDAFGNPVTGHPVRFQVVQGSAGIEGAVDVEHATDAQGHAAVTVRAGAVPGVVSIRATSRLNGMELLDSPQSFSVTVLQPPLDTSQGRIIATTPCIANGRTPSLIAAEVRDTDNNPVSGLAVHFYSSGGNNTLQPPNAVTDAQGRATTSLVSTRAEVKKIWAEVDGQRVSPDSARVLFLAGPAATLVPLDGDGQTAATARMLPAPLRAALLDSFENPVSGALLTVTMQTPDGNRIDLQRQATDAAGMVACQVSLSQQPGSHQFIFCYGDLPAITFHAEAEQSIPAFIEKISGEGQAGLSARLLANPLVVRVIGHDGAPASGIPVTFSFSSGMGAFPDGATVFTTADGMASVRVQLGTGIGNYYIDAGVAGLTDKVTFMATVRPPRPATLEIVSGDAQNARAGKFLRQPLVVRLLDELAQPVRQAAIRFLPITSGGSVSPSEPVTTGEDGTASAWWKLGTEKEQYLRAEAVDYSTVKTVFHATIHPNHAPEIFATSDTTISENQALSLWVRGTDEDHDDLIWRITDMPAGAVFDSLSGLFSWTPTYEQAGLYRITFSADDGHGGTAAWPCRIVVRNVSQPIMILSYSPGDTSLSLALHQPVTFAVEARDPDGDSLRFQWFFNDLAVGTQSSLRVTPNPGFPAKSQVVVKISSTSSTTTFTWSLDIQTHVAVPQSGPAQYVLGQNYPNPFNPTTHIPFQMAAAGPVKLSIYNQSGQRIRVVRDGVAAAGWHTAFWDGQDDLGAQVPSGIYYCRMETNSFHEIKKLLLLK